MEQSWNTFLTTAASVVAGFGGFEAIKWLIFRKKYERSAEAQADTDEFHILREQIEFLQTQLKEKEERFAEQTKLLRTTNSEILEVTEAKNATILTLTEKISALQLDLQKYRCVVPKCAKRDPQNGY
jgi:chromosome segregation ATPase